MEKKPVRVLVVDDSAFMRKALRDMLEKSPFLEVVGMARSGVDALDQTTQLHPDVVLVDLFMPDMDGVAYVREQMARKPLPIVVCSSAGSGEDLVIAAMEAGAVDFVQKPTARALDTVYTMQKGLAQAVMVAAAVPQEKVSRPVPAVKRPPLFDVQSDGKAARCCKDVALIGISTGGPRALRAILPSLPANLPVPVVIALHMPEGYTRSLARRLNEQSAVEVIESAEETLLLPRRVILARAGVHTLLRRRKDGNVETVLIDRSENNLYTPSVDALFQSAAQVYGDRTLGVVMTGMGNDGTKGAAQIKAAGGRVIVEAESTSIVYGMPRSVVEAGLADRIVPLEGIVGAILEEIYENVVD